MNLTFFNAKRFPMKRWLFFIYGVCCHLLFLVTFAYLAGFVGNLLVSKSIDTPSTASLVEALATNLGLVLLFSLQHSLMARPAFKRVWTRIIPQPIERSTYVLSSCVVTFQLVWLWQGIDLVIWDVQQPVGRALLWGLFAVGWLLVPVASLMIDHFDLFGTRQVWLYLHGREYASPEFRVPGLYKWVRHPLYVGWTLAFWVTPTMTLGHLLFASSLTVYMVLASKLEERDLVRYFGRHYEDYQRRVRGFVPRLGLPSAAIARVSR
jgi:protein-S-isoprenylcysteine O-methyltransferase Ste14